MLRDYAVMLPQEQNPETGTEALVSPELRPIAMRGLLDPALRDGIMAPRYGVAGDRRHGTCLICQRKPSDGSGRDSDRDGCGAFGGGVSMSYLVFPRVRVQAANMLSASFLMGGAAGLRCLRPRRSALLSSGRRG